MAASGAGQDGGNAILVAARGEGAPSVSMPLVSGGEADG
jgi:hypothetical protein